jgi:hypothetical protein
MVNQPKDAIPIVKGVWNFSSFGGFLICVQNWMRMVSIMSSWVVGRFFFVKKGKRMYPEGSVFLVDNIEGKKMDGKRRVFTCRAVFAIISTIFICWGFNFT